jgi:autotransporter-associated beta strand protein
MKITKTLEITLLSIVLLAIGLPNSQAQTVAIWTGSSGGDWNIPGNWSTGLVPGVSTNVSLPTNTIINYSSAMSAASIGTVTNNGGTLNVGALGFNVNVGGTSAQSIILGIGAKMNITTGGAVTITNSGLLYLNTNAVLTMNNATLTFTNTLGTYYDLAVGRGGRNNGGTVGLTNSTVILNKQLVIQGGGSSALPASSVYVSGGTLVAPSIVISNSTDDAYTYLLIDGGANVQGGDVIVQRGIPSYGLILSNGTVNVTSLLIGTGASRAGVNVYGGTLTNTGTFSMYNYTCSGTSDRKSYFYQRGGTVVSTSSSGLVIVNAIGSGTSSTAIANQGAVYDITGGTLTVEGITLVSSSDYPDVTARLNLGGSGTIYVGNVGIAANLDPTSVAIISCTNGTWGAKDDWSGSAGMLLNSGTTTFKAADADNTAHNITLTGVLSGTGNLNKTGGGTLTLNAANTNKGNVLINGGKLALGSSGSISNVLTTIVGSGTTFDVSSVSGGYVLYANQTLSGSGTVAGTVTVASTATINPGSNTLTGTLTFQNDLMEQGSAVNHLDLSGNPSGANNDLINVIGTLNVSGVNTIEISGALQANGVYKLLQYGTLSGDVTNFTLSGAGGTLSNSVAGKAIYLIALGGARAATNVTWLGNSLTNTWDMLDVTNWSINGTGIPTNFISGDNARFDNIGAINPLVNIVGSVTPGSVTVDTTSNYTFTGTGRISGIGGLTKTNTGTLTILTTNSYYGPTIIANSVIEVTTLADGGINSPIGASTADPINLVFNNGTLRHLGDSASTDRSATLNANSSNTIDVTNSAATLTMSGSLTGNGSLIKVGQGTLNLSGVNTYSGTTTLSNGTVQVNDVTAIIGNTITFAGGTLALASTSVKHSYTNTLNVVSTGTLDVKGANSYNVIASGWSGAGTLNVRVANSAAYCTLDADMTTNFTGTIRLTDDSTGTFRFNAGGSSSAAQQCVGSPTATFDLGNSSVPLLNRNGGGASYGTYYLGALAGGSSTSLQGAPSAGSPSVYQIGDNNLSTMFAGTIANGGAAAGVVSIIKTGTGTLTLQGQNTYSGATIISNGVLALSYNPTNSADGSIGSSTNIVINSGAYLDVSARSDGKLPLGSSQVLRGNGTILGSLDTTGGGTVSPGASIGTLTVTNNIILGGTVWMELDRNQSPNSDRLVSSLSSITYGGTLIVTNVGSQLHAGDTFTLFSGSGLGAASFGTVILPHYYIWNTNQLTVNGSISVTTISPPAISSVDFSGLAGGSIIINGANGFPTGPAAVLTSTNLLTPLGSWTQVAAGNFLGDGTYSVTLTVDPAAPEQFYILIGY